MRVWIVVQQFKIFVGEGKDIFHCGVDLHGWQRSAISAKLQFRLLQVVQVQMCIPKGMYKVPRL